jgi:ATP-binding cassette, subfamily C, bacterial CydD
MLNRSLLQEALKIRYYFAMVIILGIGTGILAILQAAALSKIVNGVFMQGRSLSSVRAWMTMLLFFIVVRGALLWTGEIVSKTGAASVKHDLRLRMQEAAFAAGPVRMKGEKMGEIINLTVEGTEALDAWFSEYLPQIALAVLVPLLVLAYSFTVDYPSAVIMLATAPLIPLFMMLIGKWAQTLTQKQWDALRSMSGHFLDVLRGLPTLKLFGRSKSQSGVIFRFSEEFRKGTLGVLRIAFLSALTLELVSTLSTAIVAVTLGIRLIYGHISFANAFLLLLLVPEFYLPLRQLGTKFHAGMNGDTAARDIFRFLEPWGEAVRTDTNEMSEEPLQGQGFELTFHNVSYRYEAEKGQAIKAVSLTLQKDRCTAVTGTSGSGKSTLVSLIMRFVEPDEGSIRINGRNIWDMPVSEWRQYISLLGQHPWFFHGTIEENIRIAKPEAGWEEVLCAAKLSGADTFIGSRPEGYQTLLGENGLGLSGGQKQLLAVARAFLKNAPLLVMDEPTSALDHENEELVVEAIHKLLQGRAVLLVSHHPALLQGADRILVMTDGNLTECKSWQELRDSYSEVDDDRNGVKG